MPREQELGNTIFTSSRLVQNRQVHGGSVQRVLENFQTFTFYSSCSPFFWSFLSGSRIKTNTGFPNIVVFNATSSGLFLWIYRYSRIFVPTPATFSMFVDVFPWLTFQTLRSASPTRSRCSALPATRRWGSPALFTLTLPMALISSGGSTHPHRRCREVRWPFAFCYRPCHDYIQGYSWNMQRYATS